jgi:hypothetical protein
LKTPRYIHLSVPNPVVIIESLGCSKPGPPNSPSFEEQGGWIASFCRMMLIPDGRTGMGRLD